MALHPVPAEREVSPAPFLIGNPHEVQLPRDAGAGGATLASERSTFSAKLRSFVVKQLLVTRTAAADVSKAKHVTRSQARNLRFNSRNDREETAIQIRRGSASSSDSGDELVATDLWNLHGQKEGCLARRSGSTSQQISARRPWRGSKGRRALPPELLLLLETVNEVVCTRRGSRAVAV